LGSEAKTASDQIIPIAGVKLNEEVSFVRAFAEAYSRLITYPPRSLEVLRQKPDVNVNEISRARAINMAALRQMAHLKHKGYMFLVYPSGTRYRPKDENSRRGMKEIDSYIKSFDYVLFLGMAGNTLRINPAGEHMGEDLPVKDTVVFMASDVYDTHEFRACVRPGSNGEDPKQVVADAVMAKLAELHSQAETIREEILGVGRCSLQ
jgi:glycerol-3-phosphate O-acyltransferase